MSLREWRKRHPPGAKAKTERVGSEEGKVQGEASGFYAQTTGDSVLENGGSNLQRGEGRAVAMRRARASWR